MRPGRARHRPHGRTAPRHRQVRRGPITSCTPTSCVREDQEIVKRHPQDGAELVGALDGYGPVADAILYHHERVDGGGYPAGLIGKEIPLSSRILAICCIYDTMTKRESYRPPMTPEEAMAELRSAAGNGQLDDSS